MNKKAGFKYSDERLSQGFTQHLASKLPRHCRYTVIPKSQGPKLSAGFTVVELIMATIIGAIIISSATLVLTSHLHLSQRGRDLVIANAYVEHKVEALRSIGFLGLSNGTADITAELPSELNTPRSGSLQISSYSSAIKEVDISITYNDQGTARTYSYTTYIGELGVGQY